MLTLYVLSTFASNEYYYTLAVSSFVVVVVVVVVVVGSHVLIFGSLLDALLST
jgi:hypothetical protein